MQVCGLAAERRKAALSQQKTRFYSLTRIIRYDLSVSDLPRLFLDKDEVNQTTNKAL
eukprot:gene42918-52444_t